MALGIARSFWIGLTAFVSLAAFGSAAQAATVISPCDATITNPDATACAGYYGGNILSGNATDIQSQKDAIASLPGDFEFNGDWATVEGTKVLTLVNTNQIDFGTTLYGQTIIGVHYGNVDGTAGNVTAFYLFDFGTEGATSIGLDNVQGFSNAVLYTTVPGVPEPSTWAMMLLGIFGIAGMMRYARRREGMVQGSFAAV